MTKYFSYFGIVLCLLLSACIPQTQMIQDGHEWVQLTQSYNIWGANVVKQTHCKQTELRDGFCYQPQGQNSSSVIAEAPGPKLVGAVLTSAAMVGSAGLLMNGLQTQRVPQLTGTTQNFDVSTFNTGVNYVPLKGAK